MASPLPIWLDVDTGHDDAFALLLLAQSPSLIQPLGVSTVFGNSTLSHTTHNTLAILTALSAADKIPVYAGAPKAFCRGVACAPDIHGESGLDGTTCLPTPTASARKDRSAIEAMYNAIKTASLSAKSKKPWIVATGSLTNVALALSVYPDLPSYLGGISIMGGAIGGGFTSAAMGKCAGDTTERFGNWTPYAEFNIYIDPESASAVLEHPELVRDDKLTLIPLDITHQFLATKDILQGMLYGFDRLGHTNDSTAGENGNREISQTRKLFHEILTFFASTYAEVFGLTQGPPLHDPLAVLAACVPEMFDDHSGERFAVQVVREGEHGDSAEIRGDAAASECGRTVATMLPTGQPGVRIPRTMQIDKLWRMLDASLARAEQARKA